MVHNGYDQLRAGPPGTNGYCSGECCASANGTCVPDYDTTDHACCAYLPGYLHIHVSAFQHRWYCGGVSLRLR